MSGVEFVPHDIAPPAQPVLSPPPLHQLDDELVDQTGPVRRRRRLGPRSLTARLIVGVVSLVLVLVFAIGASTYWVLRSSLANRLDQQLDSTASGQLRQLFSGSRPPPIAAVRGPQDVWVVAIGASGGFLGYASDRTVQQLKLTPADSRRLATIAPNRPTTITTTDGKQLRVQTAQISIPSDGGTLDLIVVVGLSTDEERNTLHQLLRAELVIGGSAVLLAFLASTFGVRFSLRKLRRVTATAQEVAAELSPTGAGLDRRVDVSDDGTEVGQLADSMNTLLSAVETQFAARLESEARLRQFLADASHELRTPLTSIRGYAELARMQRAAGADAEDNLSRIESEGTRMSRLVEDLLTLARGDQQAGAEPARDLVDLGELVEDAASDTRAAFPDRRVDAQPQPNLHVIGDHDQLLRAVRNLMANAAVHTAPERPILVRCAPDGDGVVMQVVDGGPGLPPDEAAHVFERFWRADKARTRAKGGSGLGLSIVASIVAAHRGTVRFDSSVVSGSTVTIRLPAVAY